MKENDREIIMSNQEAADILKELLVNTKLLVGRGSAKSLKALKFMIAVSKAITVLENTPDDKKLIAEPNYCAGCKREFSTDIVDHVRYCTYCTRNDWEGGTYDFYERRLEE